MLRLTSQTDNTVRRREMGTDTSKAEAELWARCKRGRAVDLACVNDAGRRGRTANVQVPIVIEGS